MKKKMTAEEQKLKEKLARSQEELETLNKRLQDRPELGLGTGSTGVYSWEMALARSGRIEQQIEELQQALARVAAGDYGRCDMCGERIDPERLEIVPATTLCAKCARSHAAQANGPATSRTAVL